MDFYNMYNQKIPFYKVRNFGDKVSVTFSFFQQNLRYIWKYLLYTICPVGIIFGVGMNWFYSSSMSDFKDSDISTATAIGTSVATLFGGIIMTVGMAVVLAMIFALMQLYNERDNGLQGITFEEIKPYMINNFWRVIKYALSVIVFFVAASIVFVLLALFLQWFVLLLVIPAVIILFVVVQLILPVYMFEDISIWDAWQRGIKLSWKTFGGVLALAIVFALITDIVGSVFSIPWAVCFFIKALALTEDTVSAMATSPMFNTITYILAMLMGVGTFALSLLTYVAMSYQYSNAAEQEDAFSVQDDINDFNNL